MPGIAADGWEQIEMDEAQNIGEQLAEFIRQQHAFAGALTKAVKSLGEALAALELRLAALENLFNVTNN